MDLSGQAKPAAHIPGRQAKVICPLELRVYTGTTSRPDMRQQPQRSVGELLRGIITLKQLVNERAAQRANALCRFAGLILAPCLDRSKLGRTELR